MALALLADDPDLEGRQLGAYRMGHRLGAGGIGAVYEATHVRTGRAYAVKVLLPDAALEPNALARFRREAEALAALGHASIVGVHDFDVTDDGVAFLVMDRLEGEDLAARLERRGALPVSEALAIFDQLADALETAHGHGILHRDLKPSNVFLARRAGAGERAILLDFGLAKMLEGEHAGRLTASGATMGTPMYMSPEQAQGLEVDVRTDVYSLGAILFESLAGTPPFTGPTLTAILSKVLTHPPPLLRTFQPDAPEGLQAVLTRALAKSPADRPPTIAAFQEQVHRAARGASDATPRTVEARPLPQTQVTPVALAAATPRTSAATPGATRPDAATPLPSPPSPAPRRGPLGLAIGVGVLALVGAGVGAYFALRPAAAPVGLPPQAPLEVAGAPAAAVDAGPSPDAAVVAAATVDAGAPAAEAPTPAAPTEAPPAEPSEPRRARRAGRPAPARAASPRASDGEPAQAPTSVAPSSPPPLPPERAAEARSQLEQAVARAEGLIRTYERALPVIAAYRRGLGGERERPDFCADAPTLAPLRADPGIDHQADSIERTAERLCELHATWADPPADVQERIDRLPERFARARRDLEARREEDLPPAEKTALLREVEATRRALTSARGRFPCGAPELRRMTNHAAEIGPRGAQPALELGRSVDRICNGLGWGRIPGAHRNMARLLDSTEAALSELIGVQNDIRRQLASSRDRYR